MQLETQQTGWAASFLEGDGAALRACVTPIFESVRVESATEAPARVEADFHSYTY